MIHRWSPGGNKLLVWDRGLAMLDGKVGDQQAERLWHAMRRESQLGYFLQVLMEATGQGLLNIPAFAVAVLREDGAQVAVRGMFQVFVRTEGESIEVDGRGVTTWEERFVPHVAGVEIRSAGSRGAETAQRGLPIVAGILEASRVGWGPDDETVLDPASAGGAADEATRAIAGQAPQPLLPPSPVSPVRARRADPDPLATLAPESPATGEPGLVANTDSSLEAGNSRDYDFLWDESIAMDVEGAAIREENPPGETNDVNDGLTVVDESEVDVEPAAMSAPAGPQVLATFCDKGHPNPPQRGTCYSCGARVGGSPRQVPRPQLGWLKVTGGESVPLRGPVVAGRNPKTVAIGSQEQPRLLALPHRHVSGNHIAFLLEGWTVLARDLGSSNGSYLRRHGKPPVRLPEQDTPLVPGDVIDLGHGVFINLERIP